MTAADDSLAALAPDAAVAAAPARVGGLERMDAVIRALADRLNPILVKEGRQALKSKQFSITFALLLSCGWVWSMISTAWIGYGGYGGQGSWVFYGYLCVLAFPLLVIVPFGAYRSLASEWEDGTYELMSISLLGARQIVSGKLGSAVLQMIVYLSAISPCLAFTYMLRGIDLLTIFYLLFWAGVFSLASTVIALCLATLTRARHWQVVVSVVLIAACLLNFYLIVVELLPEILQGYNNFFQFDDSYFWIGTAAFLTGVAGYTVLFFLIARSRLLFPSENRSTAIRVCLLAHYLLFAGWMGWAWFHEMSERDRVEFLIVVVTLVGVHWWVMGAFMTGEHAELSARVKRDLPQSFFGRVMFTWFNPGSGTGYLFAIINLAAVVLLAVFTVLFGLWFFPQAGNWPRNDISRLFVGSLLGFSYVTIYLGIGRLLTRAARRFTDVPMLLNVLVHILLALAGSLVPWAVAKMLRNAPGWGAGGYSLLQAPNWFWTMIEVLDDGGMPRDISALMVLLPVVAAVVFLANLPSAALEVRQLRVALPTRVKEDDAILVPPPEPEVYKSPWD